MISHDYRQFSLLTFLAISSRKSSSRLPQLSAKNIPQMERDISIHKFTISEIHNLSAVLALKVILDYQRKHPMIMKRL